MVDVGAHETRGDVALGAIAGRPLRDDRIGLSEVRNFRIAKLEQEKEAWQQLYDQRKQVTPELSALLILSVSPNLSSG